MQNTQTHSRSFELLPEFYISYSIMETHSERTHRIKREIIDYIDQNSDDVRNALALQSIHNDSDFILFLYTHGYIVPSALQKKTPETALLSQRKDAILLRYSTWKRIRPYIVAHFHRPLTNTFFFPCQKNIVIDLSTCSDPLLASIYFLRMITSYIPLYNIYQYNPLPGTGFKYYSGEFFVFFFITPEMTQQQKDAIAQAASSFIQNKIWLCVVTSTPWNGLGSWLRPHISDSIDVKLSLFAAWTGSDFIQYANISNLAHYSKLYNLLPWPYSWNQIKFN